MARCPDSDKERRWLDLVCRWRQSDLSVRDFCERHGLTETSFYCWRRVLRQRGLIHEDGSPVKAATPAFVKVTVDPSAVADAAAAIDLVLSQGRLLRLRPGFDRELLRQLLALLEEPSC